MITYLQFEKLPLKKGPWSTEEDQALIACINKYGIEKWTEMPKAAGLLRSGKSCRLRWLNYLRPNLKHGSFTDEEDEIILTLHQELGNRWSVIAAELPGRTDNEIKNRWHSHLKKKLSTNFPVQKTSTPEIKEKKFAANSVSYFPILDSSSSEYTEHNLFTSDSSSNLNSISEDNETVFSPEFYQYLDQYLEDQETDDTDYEMLIDDENSWNQSISPSGSSTSSNSTMWPYNWENTDQSKWANEDIKVGLFDELVPKLWEQQTFVMGEDFGSVDYMWSF